MVEAISFVSDIVQIYINGWKQNNLDMILSSLAEDCVIIESHGPIYQGSAALKKWFALWLQANSQIKNWDIKSFYFCSDKHTAFTEWDFSCISNGAEYSFPGISIFKFRNQKIELIHEYRMTHNPYVWNGHMLQSD